ncbi:thiolase family protein [Mycetocola zhadangensis]|uniref:Thiolase family protein n=1 Tax=Mycetocola zhadangensis TaxID=1164595 RepID=A0A3L7J2B8_9MICO|nr:thiolase family protein [Mycetocola zhadangensis]RLQ84594.1 thiolase family protein [Mycetocola zhadangensis]GGE91572.1 acetyl-CoA acetyltransferase [Mycetocola zhadangensis]
MRNSVATVIAARRTPIATVGQRLAAFSVDSLAASSLCATLTDAQLALGNQPAIGDVVLGNCMGPGGNTARVASLAAGIDVTVPGMTVDRQCGSGLAAVLVAAEQIAAGSRSMRLAGGAESASTAPTRIAKNTAYARAAFAPEGFPDPDMGPAAEALAGTRRISRDQQDAYALRSHDRAVDARNSGRFINELVTIGDVTTDDGPRPMSRAMLARFAPVFATDTSGTVTAGNSCRVSDGAATVALVPDADRGSAPGLALIGSATVGCDPATPGLGPAFAIESLLEQTGVRLDDIEAVEIVEAFAAQALAVLWEIGLASANTVDDRVCADGGALALGHPWGASGAVSVVRLFSRLVRSGRPAGTLGLATAAIGGGMGVAALFRVVR